MTDSKLSIDDSLFREKGLGNAELAPAFTRQAARASRPVEVLLQPAGCSGYLGWPLAFSRAGGGAEREPGNVLVEPHSGSGLHLPAEATLRHLAGGRRLVKVSDASPVCFPSQLFLD